MDQIEQLQHGLYAKSRAFQRKLDQAARIINEALEKIECPYLAFSGGADSTVLLDMLGGHIPIYWGDDGYDFPQTLDFLTSAEEHYGFTLRRIRCIQPWCDWCNEMGRPDLASGPEALQAWGNPPDWYDTWESLKDARLHGYSGVFLGMLACESRDRRMVLKNGSRPLYRVKSEHGMWHCSPLARWTKHDVMAYLISRNVPYNPIYDRFAELGVPLEQRRVAPLTCFRVMQFGSHAILKQVDPSLYNKLCALFPRVRCAI